MACLNEETRDKLISKIEAIVFDTDKAQQLAEFVSELPVCSVDNVQKGKKHERKLTNYNIFLSRCMHSKHDFKKCVPDWRTTKECLKNESLESCIVKAGY